VPVPGPSGAGCHLDVVVAPCSGAADNARDRAPDEIEYLITAIGGSGCDFIRNGKRQRAAEAERHVRMKYRRAPRHATTAERIIERLASRSSMSRRPYLMDCPDSDPTPSGDWLSDKLAEYRSSGR
jgi:hypothetical protein